VPSSALTPLTLTQRAELAAWLQLHAHSLLEPVRAALQQHSALCDALLGSRRQRSQMLVQLRGALGVDASSERRNGAAFPSAAAQSERSHPKSRRRRLELAIERSERMLVWHKELSQKHRRKLRATRSKLMQMPDDLERGPHFNDPAGNHYDY